MKLASKVKSALPSRTLIALVTAIGLLLVSAPFGTVPASNAAWIAAGLAAVLAALVGLDLHLSLSDWRRAPLALHRRLPHAFAVGAPVKLQIDIENPGRSRRRGRYFELTDPSLVAPAMPLSFDLGAGRRQILEFEITPTARGMKYFEAGQILLRSVLGLLDWNLRIGHREERRVFPDFRRQAALAWMASNRRLAELGIRSVRRRGSGTDFDQLLEYRPGDPIRHIDWKATLKHGRPIVRSFRDDRDQSVMFLLDCGRRMRADDSQSGIGASHFDQSLDALMLLAFVALGKGDAVGAMTFGAVPGSEKRFAPRKGPQTLNALMAELGDIEPTASFSDYTIAAADLVQRQRKRGLVVLITNCRDEDTAELGAAIRLLRSRHLVVLANLREQIVGRIAARALSSPLSVLEVAAAVEYEQRRHDMQKRLAMGGTVLIDCEPRALGVELVNRYHVLKRTGAI
ncbi:MAG TPA: DUF58 domain-containing protein [Steroidobacteraceae bacterium]|nr:DUF58 domain-containing protein [Steroidobacteraceae bacterium]